MAIGVGDESTITVHSDGDDHYSMKTIVKLDSLKEHLNEQQYIVLSEFKDSVEILFRNKIKQITHKREGLEDVIDEMVIELKDYNNTEDLSESEDILALRIKETLQDKGITQSFEFAVSNPLDDTSFVINSTGYLPGVSPDYKTRLYPERIFHKPELLLLSFPNKNSHIYRSVFWLMSGSLLFTLIIILTFYVTIRVILQQKKLSEIKTDFINNMTHEFKTPIATISLAVDSIQNKTVIDKPDKIMYFTDIIHEENKRMNSRVENILQMSLIDKNDFNFQFEETDVHDLINQAAKNIELQLNQKEGVLNLQLEAENSKMLIDKVHLLNIVTNLLDNAVKYADKKPEISVSTGLSENNFKISVKDNGIGMNKEVHYKIFDKFFRVSKGDIHNVKGFGLGLSYVKAIILAWGGSIDVKSEPGKGSEFIIKLPIN
jgi:two-component system phosphate regulon sensor histidine kinase PhoR